MRAADVTSEDALDALERADRFANADHWPGTRAERVADVQTELARGLVLGLVAIANVLEDLRRHGLPIEDVSR